MRGLRGSAACRNGRRQATRGDVRRSLGCGSRAAPGGQGRRPRRERAGCQRCRPSPHFLRKAPWHVAYLHRAAADRAEPPSPEVASSARSRAMNLPRPGPQSGSRTSHEALTRGPHTSARPLVSCSGLAPGGGVPPGPTRPSNHRPAPQRQNQ